MDNQILDTHTLTRRLAPEWSGKRRTMACRFTKGDLFEYLASIKDIRLSLTMSNRRPLNTRYFSKGDKYSDLRALSTTFPPKEILQTVTDGLSKT